MTGVGATLMVLALLYNISNSPCLFKELSKLNCKLFSLSASEHVAEHGVFC